MTNKHLEAVRRWEEVNAPERTTMTIQGVEYVVIRADLYAAACQREVDAPERISDGVERWEPTAQDVDDTIEALNHDCGHPDHNRAEVVLWMKLRIAALEQERTAAVDYRERASDDLTFLDKVRAENERLRKAIADDVPTPEKLEAWGEWFDDPKNPFIGFDTTKLAHHTSTAGYVCRVFAAQLRALGSQTRGRNAQLPDPLA